MSRFFDISPPVTENTAVFPGDVPFARTVHQAWTPGSHMELSSVQSTLHIGAHVDAPSHFHPDGDPIGRLPPEIFVGPCRVMDLRGHGPRRILPEHVQATGSPVDQPRILLRTDTFPDPMTWRDDFASLSPELVSWLASQNVGLIGIDTPSVDPADSKELEAHKALARTGIINMEGILLTAVDPGLYQLSCLPLNLTTCEASPVRAVLWK